ncbi:hypothetical protein GCM10010505_42820 [Kitasatospora aburaviensis]
MVPIDRDALVAEVARLREELAGEAGRADPARTRMLTRWIGIGLLSLGAPGDAQAFFRWSLALAASAHNTKAVVATGLNLGDAHRYAGDLPAADALYRGALATARSQCQEILDYALQHFGKHLMESGALADARTHLQEALRLRIAKGDIELLASTQAALDRVASLIAVNEAEAGATARSEWSRGGQ